ncbi:hypothetical protein QYM36_016689 [Artemia franciscana]|uniref:Uncharacterized protein n=1 Tax=Artemia franciscana TaxID=6661 RepID=A0AA88HBE8_ARTSF|nr:hypothetical protein QYM36_016689 [Artemia franciscana]
MGISLRIPVADACPLCEKFSERNNDDDVNDEEPGQELDISWRDEWLLHIYMVRKATQKYQEDASENDSPDKRVYAVDLQKVILLSDFSVTLHSFNAQKIVYYLVRYMIVRELKTEDSKGNLNTRRFIGRVRSLGDS